LRGQPIIDRIAARPKDIDRFVAKATKLEDRKPKYGEPLEQIQDQIGARIITFYQADVTRLDPIVKRWFNPIEFRDHVPESEWEFGYFGRHYVLAIPSDVIDDNWDKDLIPRFFELQVKTLFEHAWSEAEHDLGYKPGEEPLTSDQKKAPLGLHLSPGLGCGSYFRRVVSRPRCRTSPRTNLTSPCRAKQSATLAAQALPAAL
jgi:putative GTP pyrophosphokinase